MKKLIRNMHLDTGVLTLAAGPAAGTFTPGPALAMEGVEPGTLSAFVEVLAETNTITLEAQWQVSDDGVAWEYVILPGNHAVAVLATGTAGADTPVAVVLDAPGAVYGWHHCRVGIINRVVAGTADEDYQIGYNFVQAETA